MPCTETAGLGSCTVVTAAASRTGVTLQGQQGKASPEAAGAACKGAHGAAGMQQGRHIKEHRIADTQQGQRIKKHGVAGMRQGRHIKEHRIADTQQGQHIKKHGVAGMQQGRQGKVTPTRRVAYKA